MSIPYQVFKNVSSILAASTCFVTTELMELEVFGWKELHLQSKHNVPHEQRAENALTGKIGMVSLAL